MKKASEKLSFANDVVWSLMFDGGAIVANLVTFILLGRNLGDAGYGAYLGLFGCLLYTSPSPRDRTRSRMPSSA